MKRSNSPSNGTGLYKMDVSSYVRRIGAIKRMSRDANACSNGLFMRLDGLVSGSPVL